ncbi:hypothetical protein GIB67_041697 [Kingdonia uniflora]|uniref:Uncharacterized protein n=1 Tax=Kingdonia uniflora TaxID=39325 RepID=A0A7J7MQT2_9MAGN|nr:hypothetical protein GIB67_041697 [Kingdonia uniflora]
MTYASHLFCHSRKLKNAPSIIRNEYAILVRWFSREGSSSSSNDFVKIRGHDFSSTTNRFNYSCKAKDVDIFSVSLMAQVKGSVSRTAMRASNSSASLRAGQRRGFSSDSGID